MVNFDEVGHEFKEWTRRHEDEAFGEVEFFIRVWGCLQGTFFLNITSET